MLVLDNALGNPAHRHGDAVVSGSLALDDLIGAVPHLPVQPLEVLRIQTPSPDAGKVLQAQAGHAGLAPDRQLAVPVLAGNERMDVPAVHPQLLAHQLLEPSGIQHRAGADDPLPGVPGDLPGRVRQHNQQNAAEFPGCDLPDDALHDLDILADQVQPGFAGLLVGPGGDDHQAAVGDVVVGPRRDLHCPAIGQTVAEVYGLALRLFMVHIQQHHLGKQSLLEKAESDGRSHKSAANDPYFSRISIHLQLSFPISCALSSSAFEKSYSVLCRMDKFAGTICYGSIGGLAGDGYVQEQDVMRRTPSVCQRTRGAKEHSGRGPGSASRSSAATLCFTLYPSQPISYQRISLASRSRGKLEPSPRYTVVDCGS